MHAKPGSPLWDTASSQTVKQFLIRSRITLLIVQVKEWMDRPICNLLLNFYILFIHLCLTRFPDGNPLCGFQPSRQILGYTVNRLFPTSLRENRPHWAKMDNIQKDEFRKPQRKCMKKTVVILTTYILYHFKRIKKM